MAAFPFHFLSLILIAAMECNRNCELIVTYVAWICSEGNERSYIKICVNFELLTSSVMSELLRKAVCSREMPCCFQLEDWLFAVFLTHTVHILGNTLEYPVHIFKLYLQARLQNS